MEIKVIRKYKKDTYTIGKLYIDGEYFCDTLEDKDRGLASTMSLQEITSRKVYGETAIPTGTYKITLDVVSPKFGNKQFYKDTCSGKLPRLLNVKGYDGILIHVADGSKGADLVAGCIGIGKNNIVGGLTNGRNTFISLYNKMYEAKSKGELINITIV
jgi:hypothetical protein